MIIHPPVAGQADAAEKLSTLRLLTSLEDSMARWARPEIARTVRWRLPFGVGTPVKRPRGRRHTMPSRGGRVVTAFALRRRATLGTSARQGSHLGRAARRPSPRERYPG